MHRQMPVMSRATTSAAVAGVLILGVLGYLLTTWERPDPEQVVRDKLQASAVDLTEEASTALVDSDGNAEDARAEVADAHPFEVLESRVKSTDVVEWDVVLAGGASRKYVAAGQWEKFHTCFRLSGKVGDGGAVSRSVIPCPTAEDPPRALEGSRLVELPA
ncbi:hypothetical protein LWF15_12965 [Kineosporia rhizophila]|uniref:hypothetical protein n=1 Tax=Kineosporia TaxID=49184 RepID=UPI001E48B17B|nr:MULTISPECIES: hypothetical protein [Kineosporia]MCE0536423.1 hypothetical protein [Kineosporia rhizophila]